MEAEGGRRDCQKEGLSCAEACCEKLAAIAGCPHRRSEAVLLSANHQLGAALLRSGGAASAPPLLLRPKVAKRC